MATVPRISLRLATNKPAPNTTVSSGTQNGPPPAIQVPDLSSVATEVQSAAAASAPSAAIGSAIAALPSAVVAHIASVGATVQTGTPDPSRFWMGQKVNPGTSLQRNQFPLVPLYASAAAAASGQCVLVFTPTQDVYPTLLRIPSGQVVAGTEAVQSLIANQRLVNVSTAANAPITDFVEKGRGGKISMDLVRAGQPITLTLTGCNSGTTYYAAMLCYGTFETKGGPRNGRAPDYVGWLPLGITSIPESSSVSIAFQPACGFRPRLLVFDDSQTNFANITIGQIVEGVMVQGGTNNANVPAVMYSEQASEDDFFDFAYIPANTPCSLPAQNSNATAAAKLGGHIYGEVWLPQND